MGWFKEMFCDPETGTCADCKAEENCPKDGYYLFTTSPLYRCIKCKTIREAEKCEHLCVQKKERDIKYEEALRYLKGSNNGL